jgi:hypothetical protein
MKHYRFIRLDWDKVGDMNVDLNSQLHKGEEIISMATDQHEVTLLVASPVKEKK